MASKFALVTGGTSGIGKSLLPELVKAGFMVHFIGRNAEKGQAIEAELNTEHGDRVRFIQLDLSNLAEVRAFSERFSQEVPALDLLANIAGLMLPRRQVTAEGFEKTFAIGYLSAYVLSTELTKALAKAPNPRIVNVAGVARFVLKTRLDFDDLGFEKNYKGIDVAIKTVHAKTVLTQILSEHLHDKGITVNAFHPGAVQGDVMRNMRFPMSALFGLANLFMAKTSKSGIHVTTSQEVDGVTGAYFVGKKAMPLQFENAYKQQLWTRTLEMLDKVA